MADNWYLILELDFDPPVEDEGVIAAKIEERSKYWAGNFNHFKWGPQYRAWHQNLAQIKKDMLGPQNIRKQLIADACVQTYGPVDKLLKTIGKKGFVTQDEGEKMAAKLKLQVELVRRRALTLGLEWRKGSGEKQQKLYDQYYKEKPEGAANFDGMKQLLASFQTEDLYGFLFGGTSIDPKTARNMRCADLVARSQEKKKTEFSGHTSVAGSGAKLCGQCELIFKNDSEKKKYDTYLEYMRRKKVFDEIKQVADISGSISAQAGEELIGRMTEVLRDRNLAADLVAAYCAVEKISYAQGGDGAAPKNIKVCRCGCTNDVSDGRKVCKSCGLPLVIQCPACGAGSDASVRVCKCGFPFENIDKAKAQWELAERAMDQLEFEGAQMHLTEAERLWPGSSQVAQRKKRLAEYKTQVGAEVAKMRKAMSEGRYCEAQRQYQSISRLFPGYKDPEVETQTTQKVKAAQELFRKAQNSRDEKEVLELCAQAYDLCRDLPGVRELMERFPPKEVSELRIMANPNTRVNQIAWRDPSGDRSVRYVLVRSTAGWVNHVSDGEIIYRGSAQSYSDQDIAPATTYYYNVFADRAGVSSKGAQGQIREVINLFEVAGLGAVPGDKSISLTWNPLPKGATAEVYRLESTDREILLTSVTSDGYTVRNLENGQPYRFRVSLVYQVAGIRRVTRGMSTPSVTPESPALPVEFVRTKAGQEDNFEIIWEQEGPWDVRLYGSTKKPTYSPGKMMDLPTLEREMRLLQTRPLSAATRQSLKPGEQGATISHAGTDPLYVVPVVIKGNVATFGAMTRAVKGQTVKLKDVFPANGQLTILLEPPKGATGFVILYRHDTFAGDLSDREASRMRVTMAQYQMTNSIQIPQLKAQKYYLSIFAEFRLDGTTEYSPEVTRLFDHSPRANIHYTVDFRKPFFGKKEVVLKFSSDTTSFQLPEMDIYAKQGSVPMFKAGSNLVHTIPAQSVQGELTVSIPMDPAKNTYIKAFFHNEGDTAGSQLRLQSGSTHKIT